MCVINIMHAPALVKMFVRFNSARSWVAQSIPSSRCSPWLVGEENGDKFSNSECINRKTFLFCLGMSVNCPNVSTKLLVIDH